MASYRIALRERDIDVFGHVHYAEYLVFCAQARNLWLADVGIQRPGDHVVARMEIDYLAAATLAEGHLEVGLRCLAVGRSSLRLEEEVRSGTGEVFVSARSVIVRFDPAQRRAVAWTEDEHAAFAANASRC